MPVDRAVDEYVRLIEANEHMRAIEIYYAQHATVQENAAAPIAGIRALTARKANMLAKMRTVRAKCVRPILSQGGQVVLHWIYYFETLDDQVRRVEELALQLWESDLIVREQFFFDPAPLEQAP